MPTFLGGPISTQARQRVAPLLQRLGLAANLRLLLDAGDGNSYPGSGQNWTDLSGNAYNFLLGATSSAEASDPTFNGAAWHLGGTEYFSFDGGDYFTLGQANPTWANNLHKNGALYTIVSWVYFGSLSDSNLIFGTLGSSGANIGIRYRGTAAGKFNLNPGSSQTQFTSTLAYTAAAWQFVALSINENGGAAGGIFRCNGTSETFNPNYSGPSASNANSVAQIAAQGSAMTPIVTGSRMGMFAVFEGAALADADLAAIFAATRSRYGV